MDSKFDNIRNANDQFGSQLRADYLQKQISNEVVNNGQAEERTDEIILKLFSIAETKL